MDRLDWSLEEFLGACNGIVIPRIRYEDYIRIMEPMIFAVASMELDALKALHSQGLMHLYVDAPLRWFLVFPSCFNPRSMY